MRQRLGAVCGAGSPGATVPNLGAAPHELQRAAAVAEVRLRPQSRSELSQELGLSASVVSRLVGRLLTDGILIEMGAEVNGLGRPRTTLGVAPEAGALASVVLGPETVDVQLVDASGRLLGERSLPIHAHGLDPDAVVTLISEALSGRAAGTPLWGIGVSAPGVVDAEGAIRAAPDLGWTDPVPLRSILRERFGSLVTVDNDVNLMILAEAASGWAQDKRDAVLLYLGRRGIGMGAISQGALLTGATGASGEIGQLRFDLSAREATTFEQRFSLEEVSRVLADAGREATPSPMAALVEAAQRGVCREYLDSLVGALSQAIGIVALILDPEVVVLAGALRTACRGREQELEESLAQWLPVVPRLRLTELGEREIHSAAQWRCWDHIVVTGL